MPTILTCLMVCAMLITVVCLGNICRSPIGEGVLAQRLAGAGLGELVRVDSAGTGSWHVGDGADHRSLRVLEERDVPLNHVVRQITAEWLDDIDLLLAMDTSNYADLRKLLSAAQNPPALHMFRHFDPALSAIPEPDNRLNVPDPYYSELDAFREVFDLIDRASEGLVAKLRAELLDER